MKILLAFVGNRDPYYIDEKTKGQADGPILSLLSLRKFEGVELFYTTDKALYAEKAEEARKAIMTKHPSMNVQLRNSNISDPINHRQIMSELRRCNADILRQYEGADYFIYVSPGTPQMHSAWLLLAGSGEIPAILLQTRDPRQQKEGQKPLEEIDPKANWFPHIAIVKHDLKVRPKIDPKDIEIALQVAGIKGSQETIQYIIDKTAKQALMNNPVVILGENGTGKERLARFIHQMSPRRVKEFVAINCGAIPEGLIESELFGYKKGAFTGADADKLGKFKIADKGTLFLDEVGDMSPSMQVKLLRAIQEKQIDPVGGQISEDVDVRIIAATNKNLAELVGKNLFREDLFYRLTTFQITLRPLRERRQDIGILAKYFLEARNNEYNDRKKLAPAALKKLADYSWPGNVRELQQTIIRACSDIDSDVIGAEHLTFSDLGHVAKDQWRLPEFTEGFKLDDHISKYREAIIDKARNESKNDAEAARKLGIKQSNLSRAKKS